MSAQRSFHQPQVSRGGNLMPDSLKDSGPFKSVAARLENELLLLCARCQVSEEDSARIKGLAAEALDWDYLFRLAQRHAVLPLLHRSISEHARDAARQTCRQRLRDRFRENATRNLLLAGELVRISRLFESEGVHVLAYKGPALAVSAYGDLSLRRFVDLDIIVRARDVRRAGELLRSLGFTLSDGLSKSQEKFLLRRQHNIAYTRDAGRLIIELHWGLASEKFAELPLSEEVWERAETVAFGGGEVRSLSTEDLLLALCVHGTKHLWERLALVCDVAELLNSRAGLDWGGVLRRAQDTHTERMLLLGLRLANGLLGAALPEGMREAIQADPTAATLSESVAEKLFSGAEFEPSGFAASVRFNLLARRGLREKIRYFRFILTPTDGDLAALSLPPGLSFVYYFLRPVRLLRKGKPGQ